jgi:hypothetical protein
MFFINHLRVLSKSSAYCKGAKSSAQRSKEFAGLDCPPFVYKRRAIFLGHKGKRKMKPQMNTDTHRWERPKRFTISLIGVHLWFLLGFREVNEPAVFRASKAKFKSRLVFFAPRNTI